MSPWEAVVCNKNETFSEAWALYNIDPSMVRVPLGNVCCMNDEKYIYSCIKQSLRSVLWKILDQKLLIISTSDFLF